MSLRHASAALLALGFLVPGCGKRKARPPEDAGAIAVTPPVDAEPADAAPPRVELPPAGPATRALWRAAEAVDGDAVRDWLRERRYFWPERPSEPGERAPPAAPAEVEAAVAALVAWHGSSEPLAIGCVHGLGDGPALYRLFRVLEAAFVLSGDPDSPEIAALLAAAVALRDPANGDLTITVGVALAHKAATFHRERGWAPGARFDTHAPTRAIVQLHADAMLRCALDGAELLRAQPQELDGHPLLATMTRDQVIEHEIAGVRAVMIPGREQLRGTDDPDRLEAIARPIYERARADREHVVAGLLAVALVQTARIAREVRDYETAVREARAAAKR